MGLRREVGVYDAFGVTCECIMMGVEGRDGSEIHLAIYPGLSMTEYLFEKLLTWRRYLPCRD